MTIWTIDPESYQVRAHTVALETRFHYVIDNGASAPSVLEKAAAFTDELSAYGAARKRLEAAVYHVGEYSRQLASGFLQATRAALRPIAEGTA